jgi:hypothetical protein
VIPSEWIPTIEKIVSMSWHLVALYFALTVMPIFRAEAVVTEVHDAGKRGVASLANRFDDLDSLARKNLPGTGGEREAKVVLQSRRLVE